MGRFVRSVTVPVKPKTAYRNLERNLVWMLRDLPEVVTTSEHIRRTNRSIAVTVRTSAGGEGTVVLLLELGWRWTTPLKVTTASPDHGELPPFVHPATGTVAVRGGGEGAEVEVVVDVEGVADDDPVVGALLDRGAAVLTARLPQRRIVWY